MNTSRAPVQDGRSIHAWLFAFYLLFVIYGSLVPLRYVDRSLDNAILAFQNIPFLDLGIGSRADWVANLLLFIPLTFFACMVMNHTGGIGQRLVVSLVLVFSSILLSVSIEFTQLFFPQRTVSQNDIFAESLGGFIGVGCHWIFGWRIKNWVHGLWNHQSQQDRLIKLLHAYLLVLFLFNVLPLDLTLSPVDLLHKWNEGRISIVPFHEIKSEFSDIFYSVITDIIVWFPAGILWAMQPNSTMGKVIFRGVIVSGTIEVFQLFVYSRFTDVNQVIHAAFGVFCGFVVFKKTSKALPLLLNLLVQHRLLILIIWVSITLCIFWFPFNFNFNEFSFSSFVTAFTRMPFTTYYFTSEYHAVNELLRKIGFFVPGGLLLGLFVYGLRKGQRRVAITPLVILMGLALIVECGQLLLPGKVADVTDATLEFAGGLMGYFAALWMGSPSGSYKTTKRAIDYKTSEMIIPVQLMQYLPSGYKAHLTIVFIMSFLAAVAFRLPGMPYNVTELVSSGVGGMCAVVGICLVVYSMANGIFLLFTQTIIRFWMIFPLWLVVHGCITWWLLRVIVPLESLEDIVGSPVLGWPWQFEMMGRYVALHLCLMMQLVGALLCVRVIINPASLAHFLYWMLINTLLAWPLYLIVVQWAATDNLTELMADNASFLAASALASALFLTCLAASTLSASFSSSRRVLLLITLAFCSLVGASWLYWMGVEHQIVKYGKVFSAFQFLLSPDREHYVNGVVLVVRYGMTLVFCCAGLAAMQLISWRWLVRSLHTPLVFLQRMPTSAH